MSTYSLDLRKRIVAGRQDGEAMVELAKRFKVSLATAYRYWERYQQSGNVEPLPLGGYRTAILKGHEASLREWITKEPGLTLEEMVTRCEKELGVQVKKSALANYLIKLGLSYKKNATRRRARSSRS